MPRERNKLGQKKPITPHVRPSKPKHQRFATTAKEQRIELIKEVSKNRSRNPEIEVNGVIISHKDQTINWEKINSTTNKVQPLGGVFQNKTVIKKTSVYAPISVRRYKRFSKD